MHNLSERILFHDSDRHRKKGPGIRRSHTARLYGDITEYLSADPGREWAEMADDRFTGRRYPL